MYQRCSRLSDAETTLRQALSALQRFHSADSHAALDCLSSLAFLLRQQGRLDEADPIMCSALQGSRRVFGASHPKTILVQNNYSALLMNRAAIAQAASNASASNIFDDAEMMMRDALSHQMSSSNETDPITLQAMHNLAVLLHTRYSDSEEALELMRKAARCRSAYLGISNIHTIASQSALITILLKRGADGISEAEDLMRSMIDIHHDSINEWVTVLTPSLHVLCCATVRCEAMAGGQDASAAPEKQRHTRRGLTGERPSSAGSHLFSLKFCTVFAPRLKNFILK
jgi:tetratricopeptide (TPR) repeat protein